MTLVAGLLAVVAHGAAATLPFEPPFLVDRSTVPTGVAPLVALAGYLLASLAGTLAVGGGLLLGVARVLAGR